MTSKLALRFGIFMLLNAFHLVGSAQNQANTADVSFSFIEKQFKNPGKQFGSAPLWVWNADVSNGKIDSMLVEFKANAFGGVFIHPRPGLITPYLSDKWLALYTYAVKKGKDLGLEVWIYDENSYPSGFAGGHVPEEMPSSYNQGQMLKLSKSTTFSMRDSSFIALKATAAGFKVVDEKDENPNGDYYFFEKGFYGKSPWYGGYSYVDLLAKGVTEKFIDVTMRGYEKHFGNEFGKTVPGIFTDEPNIEVQGRDNIRWTPDLFDVFLKRWGYDLKIHLPSLYEEVGDWKKVRHNYYQVLLQLFIDRWSKPWFAYTEEKKLAWTGHYWEHGWPNPNHGGDNMAMYAWHQRPAIDMLFNQFDEESPNAQFGNIRAVKELASVANQLGRQRTLSETYGGGGWELTFQDMKRLGDWQYVLGVNSLNQHLSYMTMVGARKYDYPQSFSYHSPWWPYYERLNKYYARLSLALASGRQINDILVLEPTTSAWMYSTYDKANPRRSEIGSLFQTFVTKLEREQVEYDLGSENIIKDHGHVDKNRFVVGKRNYAKVIIPPGMENLDSKTAVLLNEFIKNGGEVIVLEAVKYIDGSASENQLSTINTKLKPALINNPDMIEQLRSRDLRFKTSGTAVGKLYHQRRQLGDGQLLFIVNSSLEEKIQGSFEIKQKNVLLLDLMNGDIHQYPVISTKASQVVSYELPPAGSLLFYVSDHDIGNYPLKRNPSNGPEKKIKVPTRVKLLDPNVLTIDFVDLHVGAGVIREKQVFHASDTLYKHFGFADGNPWNTSVQYKDNIIKRDTMVSQGGFSVDYKFMITEQVDLKKVKVAIERPWLWEILLNNKPVVSSPKGWYLDKDIAMFEIGGLLNNGENVLTLKADRMRIHAEVEPVYILGDFDLKSAAKGFEIVKASPAQLGSWKALGKPMYGKSVSYGKTFVAQAGRQYRIKLNTWSGTAAVIKLNGQLIGDLSYAPFEYLLPAGLKPGKNLVEVVVVGSLKNTLGPHHNAPKPGMVSPWHWRGVKNYPSGDAYSLYDYGLKEDFDILELSNTLTTQPQSKNSH